MHKMDNSGLGCSSGTSFGTDREDGRCCCGRPLDMVDVFVTPTTGGQFQLKVAASDTVEYLRKVIAKRLRVPKERICLLHRERHLRDGTLGDNSILDGSRITLLPSVETGLLTQRPEQSVMQALESLNDGQVNDFLSGKAPLNLTMRLGDHMMLIQLQLSTVSPSSGSSSKRSSQRSSNSSHIHDHHHYVRQGHGNNGQHSINCPAANQPNCYGLYSSSHTCPSLLLQHNSSNLDSQSPSASSSQPSHSNSQHNRYSHPHHPSQHGTYTPMSSCPNSPSSSNNSSPAGSPYPMDYDPPVRGCPHQDTIDADPSASLNTKALAEASRNLTQTLKQLSNQVLTTKPADKEAVRSTTSEKQKSSEKVSTPLPTTTPSSGVTVESCSSTSVPSSVKRQGAIIESMHHHGKGVYSGTFSGTLNPALQDRQGRPKRDISTIIHILNDLLCATPQYRRHSASSKLSKEMRSSPPKPGHSQSRQLKPSRKSPEKESADDNSDSSVDDSQVTRSKLEQLKCIMEQRRAIRKARRDARATPYGNSSSVNSSATSTTTRWSSEATTVVTSTQESSDDKTKNKDCDLKPAVVA